MAEKSAAEYLAEKEIASRPKRVAELSEIERAALGPAAIRAMEDSENARDSIDAKHKAAAEAAAKARAIVAQLPEWVRPRALGYDHRGQRIEVECDHPPLPLADGRVLLRLTRRKPRPTPNTTGNVGAALAKLGADSQTFEPAESRWLAVGGIFKAPPGKSIVIWALHRPAKVALNDADLSKGYVLDSPQQLGPGYEGEALVRFQNTPEQILQLIPGHFCAVAELVDG
jgi:hypothetical protein